MNIVLTILSIAIMTFSAALGAALLKKASTSNNKLFILMAGCVFYGTASIVNIVLLKYLPYTLVYPCGAINYIWALILAKYMFNEHISRNKIIGILFIGIGVFLLT